MWVRIHMVISWIGLDWVSQLVDVLDLAKWVDPCPTLRFPARRYNLNTKAGGSVETVRAGNVAAADAV